jgi:hypothetical protein
MGIKNVCTLSKKINIDEKNNVLIVKKWKLNVIINVAITFI